MKRLAAALVILFHLLCSSVYSETQWSIEHHRGLSDKQRGDLTVTLFGNRVFGDAFVEPTETFFRKRIPATARVELIVSITETPGTVWDSNPMRGDIPDAPARLCVVLCRDWYSPYGRWFSIATIEVRPGTHRLVVPIQPWAWVSVYGKVGNSSPLAREKFRGTWTDWARVGMGAGGYFKSHGNGVLKGQGTIKVLSERVLP